MQLVVATSPPALPMGVQRAGFLPGTKKALGLSLSA